MDKEELAYFQQRWDEAEAERQVHIRESEKDFIAETAWLCWAKDDLRFFLVENPIWRELQQLRESGRYAHLRFRVGKFNGYVRFPKLPMVAPGWHGILDYVPVHGGITFYQEWWDGSVTYGFDTGHAISQENIEIVSDVEWMMAETESMARSIRIASRFERFYLNARDDNRRKARVIDRMQRFLPMEDLTMNVLLNLFTGEL